MNSIDFDFSHAITSSEIPTSLVESMQKIQDSLQKKYETHYAFLNLPEDKELLKHVKELAKCKRAFNPKIHIVIGIGGSNLGAYAVLQAIDGYFYNEHKEIKTYFADSIDAHYIKTILAIGELHLQQGEEILISIISKSGTTTETVVNAQIFLSLLQKYKKDWQKNVVIITEHDSALFHIAKTLSIDILPVPKKVGGRFSVFSAVGLFPLAIAGIDIDELCKGAAESKKSWLSTDKNSAAKSALFLYEQYKNGKNIHDMFLFAHELEGVGKWYRQLMGESIGKETDLDGKKVNIGITPTVSIGTVDLHSVAQLYLAGPNDKTTTFARIKKWRSDLVIPSIQGFEKLAHTIAGKTAAQVMDAIVNGVFAAYIQQKRSFIVIELPELSAYYIGQLLQIKMVEIVYLAALLHINPFDQPHVELYKNATRKMLSHG